MEKHITDLIFGKICEEPDKLKHEPSFIKTNAHNPDDKIYLKTQTGVYTARIGNLTCCSATGVFTNIHQSDAAPVATEELFSDIEIMLRPYNFVKCRHSCIINIDYIKEIIGEQEKEIILLDGTVLLCSDEYLEDIYRALRTGFISITASEN
ncbi:MAG: LytTR family transcriptional regulator DNA-binding domain-containing protein [Bacteroidia bacterium]|nr:LytTR family transcriptional regulator DNA-binding domain-containing protein [Bacteroidia bacterium]